MKKVEEMVRNPDAQIEQQSSLVPVEEALTELIGPKGSKVDEPEPIDLSVRQPSTFQVILFYPVFPLRF